MRLPRVRRVGRALVVLAAACFAYAAVTFLTLPDVRALKTSNPPTTAFIELRAREAHSRGEQARRVQRWVSYGRISQNLKRAVLVTEDSAFWKHDGLDYQQIMESMEVNLERGEFARGASTITQQLAKNLYLSPSKNPIRKLKELLIARRLEAELTKQRILEIYLNVIEWGDGIYGAEAAARSYFGKSAAELSPSESALLAAAITNPRLMNPGNPTARLRRRQAMVMGRMGAVTPPPVIATVPAADGEGKVDPAADIVPGLPPVGGLPAALPGQALPPPKKPGGGGAGV
ncbi:MAG: monofunctional biosynthetic peptidoglycan transglycosylase [Vicinamibacterales bacterium]